MAIEKIHARVPGIKLQERTMIVSAGEDSYGLLSARAVTYMAVACVDVAYVWPSVELTLYGHSEVSIVINCETQSQANDLAAEILRRVEGARHGEAR